MRIIRYSAAAATALMGLMNLPIAFGASDDDIPTALAWLITALGLAGIVAAVGLVTKRSWGPAAVVVVGALNLIGSIVALTQGGEGAIVGLVVSTLGLGLGLATLRAKPTPQPA